MAGHIDGEFSLERALGLIRAEIFRGANAAATKSQTDSSREAVEEAMLRSLSETEKFQAFSVQDFLWLMQISILGVAYAGRKITNIAKIKASQRGCQRCAPSNEYGVTF